MVKKEEEKKTKPVPQAAPTKAPVKDQFKKKTEPEPPKVEPAPAKVDTHKNSASPIKKGKTPQTKEIKKAESKDIKEDDTKTNNNSLFQGANPFASFKKQFKDIQDLGSKPEAKSEKKQAPQDEYLEMLNSSFINLPLMQDQDVIDIKCPLPVDDAIGLCDQPSQQK